MTTPKAPGAPIPFALFLYAETPVHVGSGSSLGAVDLPIQRERMTGLPTLPATGLRGALREQLQAIADSPGKEGRVLDWFGAPEGAGGVTLDDAKLLLFPLRALRTGWVWATSPMLLDRLRRDLELIGLKAGLPGEISKLDSGHARLAKSGVKGTVLIEEQAYTLGHEPTLVAWIEIIKSGLPDTAAYKPFRDRLSDQVVLLSDDDLCELTQTATEVVTRVRIAEETHTVAPGALWTEEHVPAESMFWCAGQVADHARKPKPKKDTPKEADEAAPVDDPAADASGVGKLIMSRASDQSQALSKAVAALGRLRIGGNQGVGRGRLAITLQRAPDLKRTGGGE
jgi:CRISPR-associated protein Cmr4